MGKTEEHEGKKYCWLMIICHIKHQTKFKKIIDTEKFNDTKILIDSDHKLPDYMTLKNVMISMTCFIKMPINII